MKSVKLEDNKFLDSTGIMHNRELLSTKVIHDSGSNTNGSWIRFEDGTMICRNTLMFSCNYETFGNVYKYDLNSPFTFPQEFMSNPSVACNTINDTDYAHSIVYGLTRNSRGITFIRLIRFNYSGTGSTPISYIAMGKWK